jgi:hypothetical protein
MHLGNYFGAIQRWVEMQNAGEDVIYSIADLHAITLPQVSNIYNIRKLVVRYILCVVLYVVIIVELSLQIKIIVRDCHKISMLCILYCHNYFFTPVIVLVYTLKCYQHPSPEPSYSPQNCLERHN